MSGRHIAGGDQDDFLKLTSFFIAFNDDRREDGPPMTAHARIKKYNSSNPFLPLPYPSFIRAAAIAAKVNNPRRGYLREYIYIFIFYLFFFCQTFLFIFFVFLPQTNNSG